MSSSAKTGKEMPAEVEECMPMVRAMAKSVFAGASAPEIELSDLIQEGALSLWLAYTHPSRAPGSPLWPFAQKSIYSKMMLLAYKARGGGFLSARTKPAANARAGNKPLHQMSQNASSPEEDIDAGRQRARVMEFLVELTPLERELALSIAEGRSVSALAIGRKYGVGRGTVYDVRKAVRKRLEEYLGSKKEA